MVKLCSASGNWPLYTSSWKFVKRYANCWDVIGKALADFQDDVHKGQFPLAEHSFTMKEDEYQAFLHKVGKS